MPTQEYNILIKSTSDTPLWKPTVVLEEELVTLKKRKKGKEWFIDNKQIAVDGKLKIAMIIRGPMETPFEVNIKNNFKNQTTYDVKNRKVGDKGNTNNTVLQDNVTA